LLYSCHIQIKPSYGGLSCRTHLKRIKNLAFL
jgi:hypothetical protein